MIPEAGRSRGALRRGCLLAAALLAAGLPALAQQPVIDPLLVRLTQPEVRADIAAYGAIRPEQPPEDRPFGGMLSLDTDAAGRTRVAAFIELPSAGQTAALDALRAAGAEIGSVVAGIAVVRIPLGALHLLPDLPVVRVEAARTLQLVHDSSMLAIGAHVVRQRSGGQWTGTTGAGAIVGIIDTGLDITHPDFRDDDGTTRVAGLWDMLRGGTPPAGFTYGLYCSRNAIQAVVATGSTASCPTVDINGHGTHVAGTAAGNGAASADYVLAGVAPRADLLIVRAGNGIFGEDRVIDGTVWIREQSQAMGRPVVLNLSLGHQAGPHDGTLLFERMLDDMSGPGFVVVAAAGNEGENGNTVLPEAVPPQLVHARLEPPAGVAATAEFVITPYSPSIDACLNNFVNINGWYEVRDRMHVTVTRPSGGSVTAAPGTSVLADDATGRVEISNAVPLQPQGTAQVSILISGCGPGGPPGRGTWTLSVTSEPVAGATGQPIDFYISTVRLGTGRAYGGTGFDNRFLIGSPAAARRAIAVGAFTTRTCWPALTRTVCYVNPSAIGDIAPFSVAGPTRDGRLKPEITAPGVGIMSALSAQANAPADRIAPGGHYWVIEGTSMATPHVAGAVALMMEHRPGLTPEDVLDVFSRSARQDGFTARTYGPYPGSQPRDWWGYGKLDVPAALAELLGGGTVASLAVQPAADSLPLGGTLTLRAEALDDSGSPVFANVQWTSLDPDVATVGAHGVARGVGLGVARIVAQADAHADTALLAVAPPALLTIAVSSAAPAGPVTGAESTILPLLAISLEADGPEGVQVRQLAVEVTGTDPAARLVLVDDPGGEGEPAPGASIIASREVVLDGAPLIFTLPVDTLVVQRNTVRTVIFGIDLSGRAPTGTEFSATLEESGTRTITTNSRVEDRFVMAGAVASGPASTTVLREGELFALSENPVRRDSVIFSFAERPSVAAVYTVAGGRVADLLPRFDGLSLTWNLTNDTGSRIAPGVYILVFRVDGELIRQRLIVLSPRVHSQ